MTDYQPQVSQFEDPPKGYEFYVGETRYDLMQMRDNPQWIIHRDDGFPALDLQRGAEWTVTEANGSPNPKWRGATASEALMAAFNLT